MLPCPHFVKKKRPFSQKHRVFMSYFSNFHEKTPVSGPYLAIERQFCQNYTIFLAKKDNRMPIFSYFSRKNHYSHAHIM